MKSSIAVLVALTIAGSTAAAAQTQAPAVPRPFPGSAPPSTQPSQPASTPARPADPVPASTAQPPGAPVAPPQADPNAPALPAGIPVFPSADFLQAGDAGRGQTYYLYGTNAPYLDAVNFYKTQLRSGGRELFKAPAMQQFDLGRFQEDAMAYPPSIVVKDYTWNGSEGYLFVAGTQEKRYKTIIQIVPPSGR